MAAWGGGGAADQGETQQSSRKAMSETPTRHVEGPKTSTTRCVPSRRKRGSGPQTAGPARGKGRRAAAGPPGRPRFRRFPGNRPTYSADPSARSAPAASDEALLCAEAGASSPEEHGRRPVEAEGLTLLVKGFSGAGHPPLGPVPVQIAVLTATTTTAVCRRETENVRYF